MRASGGTDPILSEVLSSAQMKSKTLLLLVFLRQENAIGQVLGSRKKRIQDTVG